MNFGAEKNIQIGRKPSPFSFIQTEREILLSHNQAPLYVGEGSKNFLHFRDIVHDNKVCLICVPTKKKKKEKKRKKKEEKGTRVAGVSPFFFDSIFRTEQTLALCLPTRVAARSISGSHVPNFDRGGFFTFPINFTRQLRCLQFNDRERESLAR